MGCICMNELGQEETTNQRNHIISNCNESQNRNNHSERSRRIANNINQNADLNEYHQRNIEPYLQSINDPDFNFKEGKDKYFGEGLKKMKGYISPISKDDLLKRRRAFWETRLEGNQETWNFLRQICEDPDFQHEDIREYLIAIGIVPYKNCLNVTYDTFGGLYEIPNYCIHDPLEYDIPEDHKVKPEETQLKIIIRRGTEQIVINTSNYTFVSKFKEDIYNKMLNKNNKEKVNQNKMLLFFGGKEMKDDKQIWLYNVIDEDIVLLMVRN